MLLCNPKLFLTPIVPNLRASIIVEPVLNRTRFKGCALSGISRGFSLFLSMPIPAPPPSYIVCRTGGETVDISFTWEIKAGGGLGINDRTVTSVASRFKAPFSLDMTPWTSCAMSLKKWVLKKGGLKLKNQALW